MLIPLLPVHDKLTKPLPLLNRASSTRHESERSDSHLAESRDPQIFEQIITRKYSVIHSVRSTPVFEMGTRNRTTDDIVVLCQLTQGLIREEREEMMTYHIQLSIDLSRLDN